MLQVKVDDTGVYHGHSAGVTKYSLLDGLPVWHVNTEDSVLHGVQVRAPVWHVNTEDSVLHGVQVRVPVWHVNTEDSVLHGVQVGQGQLRTRLLISVSRMLMTSTYTAHPYPNTCLVHQGKGTTYPR